MIQRRNSYYQALIEPTFSHSKMPLTRLFLNVFLLIGSVQMAYADTFAKSGYGPGQDGIILLTDKCPADASGQLKIAVKRIAGSATEGCYVINNRGNVVAKWRTGVVEEISWKVFGGRRLDGLDTDLPASQRSELSCKQMFQAWVFNTLLEEGCGFNLKVSAKLGANAKAMCPNLDERQKNAWSTSVFRDVKSDIETMGQSKFCSSNRAGYRSLAQ